VKVGDLVKVDFGPSGGTYVGLIVRIPDPYEDVHPPTSLGGAYDFEVWLAEANGAVPVYRNEIAEIISERKE